MAPPPEARRATHRPGVAELPRGNAELLDLEVQRLVVHAEQSRRLALVPSRGLKGDADRPAFGVHRSRPGELLQRGAGRRWLSQASIARQGSTGRVDGEYGEVLRLDDVGSEEAGPPNDVPELAHVPGPLVAHEDLSRRF